MLARTRAVKSLWPSATVACRGSKRYGTLAGSDFGVRSVIDPDGYRPNVGIILMRDDGSVFWARRVSRDGWQFPQGGMNSDETPLEAMYRELREETGLSAGHVEVLGATPGWLRYRLPRRCVRQRERPMCIGQKQVWFLLRLTGDEGQVRLDFTDKPEFSEYRWVEFWYPLEHVVSFKRDVYLRALRHLAPIAQGLAADAAIMSRRPALPEPLRVSAKPRRTRTDAERRLS
jgi:putative (di)nucleoside polyphosphate hydrolase